MVLRTILNKSGEPIGTEREEYESEREPDDDREYNPEIPKISARTIPKGMMLIGHTMSYDIYQSKRGIIYHYFGKSMEDYKNPKYWERVYSLRSKKSVAQQMIERENKERMKKVA
jgi:hypothetical protein